MRAALLENYGEPLIIVDDVDIEPPHHDEVQIRIAHCGVCHSDLSVVDGTFPAPVPTVLGHEAAGVVESVGDGVTTLVPGDRVVLTPCPPCGQCYYCQRGEFSICVNSLGLITSTLPDGGTRLSRGGQQVFRGLAIGGFGELATVQETAAIKVPDDVPLDIACVIGCAVQTGVGAVINTASGRARRHGVGHGSRWCRPVDRAGRGPGRGEPGDRERSRGRAPRRGAVRLRRDRRDRSHRRPTS